MTIIQRTFCLGLTIAALLCVTGCSQTPQTTSPSETKTPQTSAATPSQSDPSSSATAAWISGDAQAADLEAQGTWTMSDVTLTSGSDSDEVAITIVGDDVASLPWLTHFTTTATTQSKGDPIDVAAGSFLQVQLRGLSYSDDPASEPAGLIDHSTQAIAGVYVEPVVDGQAVVTIGLDHQRDYQVLTPTSDQLVIQIRH